MKTNISLFFMLCFILISCKNSTNKYEKLIAQYAQTNKKGVFTDCQFKAIEIIELPAITVGDSIKILKASFNLSKDELISSIESNIEYAEINLDKEEKSKFKIPSIINTYKQRIITEKNRLDSIQDSKFINIYANQPEDKILLQPVKCKYSYSFPANNPRQERVDIFYFTADLQKIIKQTKQK